MFRNWTKSDIIFYGASMVLIITAGIIFEAAFISLVISIVGITAGIMNMKADKYCYLFYIVQITLYAFVSWRNRFIGEAVLAAFYLLPLYIYSSVRWLGKKSVKADFQIFRITKTYCDFSDCLCCCNCRVWVYIKFIEIQPSIY